MPALLDVQELKTHFPVRQGLWRKAVQHIRAVDGVSFTLQAGETLGLVGESGCGKSTVGRSILHLTPPTSGEVIFDGTALSALSSTQLRELRIQMQMIFQNPLSSLNPRLTVEEIVTSAPLYHGLIPRQQVRKEAARLLDRVGMSVQHLQRFPHEFSGGQRQRLCIARALSLNPRLIICDEAVSALDVSIQAQILNLLKDLQADQHLSYLFISHDMGVIRYIADRVAVMYLGRVVELADKETLFQHPKHPYTQALLQAIPADHPRRRRLKHQALRGDVPSPTQVYAGCPFADRCPLATDHCRQSPPPWRELAPGHHARCHLAEPTPHGATFN